MTIAQVFGGLDPVGLPVGVVAFTRPPRVPVGESAVFEFVGSLCGSQAPSLCVVDVDDVSRAAGLWGVAGLVVADVVDPLDLGGVAAALVCPVGVPYPVLSPPVGVAGDAAAAALWCSQLVESLRSLVDLVVVVAPSARPDHVVFDEFVLRCADVLVVEVPAVLREMAYASGWLRIVCAPVPVGGQAFAPSSVLVLAGPGCDVSGVYPGFGECRVVADRSSAARAVVEVAGFAKAVVGPSPVVV